MFPTGHCAICFFRMSSVRNSLDAADPPNRKAPLRHRPWTVPPSIPLPQPRRSPRRRRAASAVAATGKRHDSHHNGHHQQHHTGSHPGDNQCLAVLLRRGRWLPKLLILLRLTAELVGPTGLLGRLNKVGRRAVGIWLRRAHGCRAPNCGPSYCGAGLTGPSMGLGPPNCGGGCVTLVPRLRDSRTPTASPASKIHPGRTERITA